MKRRTLLLIIFVVTIIVSIFVFIKYEGYVGMFDFLKKEQDTTNVEIVEGALPIAEQTLSTKEPTQDTVYIYRVIVGSFKDYENAKILSESLPFSDIITNDGWYRVSKNTHFNKEDAQIERDILGEDVWVLTDFIFLEIL